MKMNVIKMFQILLMFALFSLVACAPSPAPTPTLTAVPTLVLTATPVPNPITGTIFWDANGSGLQDETSFIIPEFDPSDPPFFFELLAANGTGLGNLSPGEQATVPEPPVPGIGVCLGKICTETSADGIFTLQPDKTQSTYYLKFTDPNANDLAKTFRYINKWNGLVVIESYEINGLTVPEQHLYDTEIIELDCGVGITADEKKTFGLMQGFLTMMYQDKNPYKISCWYDHDDEFGTFLNFLGDKDPNNNPANVIVSGDNHDGIDFDVPDDTYVFSLAEGKVNFADEIPNNRGYGPVLHTTIDHLNKKYASGTGHHSLLLVNPDDSIYRGQIIALSGHSGTQGPHIHLNIHHYEKGVSPPPTMDPFGTLFDTDNNYEKLNWWTVYNIPQFPRVEIIE